jgi:ligand-binding SRPBCC domain-containing protein
MPQIVLETFIKAPAEVCFDLMRDVRLHTETTMETDERAVAGVTDGMIGLGQTVTFEGKHLGFRQRLTVLVTEFERPWLFTDEMIEGNFSSFKHVHQFDDRDGGTLMRDTIVWTSPLGFLGKIVDRLILERHLRNLVAGRNARLKQLAEDSHPNS